MRLGRRRWLRLAFQMTRVLLAAWSAYPRRLVSLMSVLNCMPQGMVRWVLKLAPKFQTLRFWALGFVLRLMLYRTLPPQLASNCQPLSQSRR